ncbi:hypothetical protein AVEN_194762-1, partial [Araneus ventricosus]
MVLFRISGVGTKTKGKLFVVLPKLPPYIFPSRSRFGGYPDFGATGSCHVVHASN